MCWLRMAWGALKSEQQRVSMFILGYLSVLYGCSIDGNYHFTPSQCKYLGTLLDTETDIERRKNLTYIAFNKYRQTLTCRNLSLYLRIRLFDVYVTSIFMYNSELWTLTKSLEKKN